MSGADSGYNAVLPLTNTRSSNTASEGDLPSGGWAKSRRGGQRTGSRGKRGEKALILGKGDHGFVLGDLEALQGTGSGPRLRLEGRELVKKHGKQELVGEEQDVILWVF